MLASHLTPQNYIKVKMGIIGQGYDTLMVRAELLMLYQL